MRCKGNHVCRLAMVAGLYHVLINASAPGAYAEANAGAVAPASLEDAAALYKQAVALHRQGKYTEALPLAEQALAIYQRLAPGLPPEGHVIACLGALHAALGHHGRAESFYRHARDVFERSPDTVPPETRAYVYTALGAIYRDTGDEDRTLQSLERARTILQKAKNAPPLALARTLATLGMTYTSLDVNL